MESDREVQLFSRAHLHLIVTHSLQLLRLLLYGEILELSNEASSELHNLVCEGGRVEAVLGSHIQLCQVLLEQEKAFVVRGLNEKLVSFVIHDHLESTQVKVALAGR